MPIADEDVALNHAIGTHGLPLLQAIAARKGRVNILTHCNAGWPATVDWGTATSPIYQAHDAGLDLHVWVDETRPRNQGAQITAWEPGLPTACPITLITDNAAATDAARRGGYRHRRHRPHHRAGRCVQQDRHLPQGAGGARQRRALLCALPSPTIDWRVQDGLAEIPIEEAATTR